MIDFQWGISCGDGVSNYHQGERQKAARGELRLPLPAGLVQVREGGIALNPDEEVQARLRLVFDIRAVQSAKAVMHALQQHGLTRLWCMDQRYGRNSPLPLRDQLMRT
jgi:hypothetical protein